MAVTVSGFYGTVTDVAEAQRLHRVSPPLVWNSTDLKATSSGTRVITMAAGQVVACGIHYIETATKPQTLAANSSGNPRIDIVGIRLTWTPGVGGTAVPFVKQGTPAASPVRPALTRDPGNIYEIPIAAVYVRNGISTIASGDVYDCRVWSGRGGQYWMADTNGLNHVDLPHGSYINIGASRYQVWTVDGSGNITTLMLSATTSSWSTWTPNIYGSGHIWPLSATTVIRQGAYRVRDGACEIKCNLVYSGAFAFNNPPYDLYLPIAPKKLDTLYLPISVHNIADYPAVWIEGYLRVQPSDGRWARIYITTHGTNDFRQIPLNWDPSQVVVHGKYLI